MDADRPRVTRRWPVLAALAAAILFLLGALSLIRIRTDMTEFLPQGRTEAARLVMEEARAGSATGLILIGIEGAPLSDLARLSRAVQTDLAATGLFQLVAGGEPSLPQGALDALFARRYQLADADFSVPALHRGMEDVLRQLRTAAAPLALRFGLADPAGAFFRMLRGWAGETSVRSIEGAWFAAHRDRALLLARTKAGGMDVTAQEAATAAIDHAFAAASPGPARLLVAGPAIFARDAARTIRADVERISLLSTLAVALLLWWRFRSLLVIAAIAAPVVASVAVAALVAQAVFGTVHGVALGFGATMLGVSVDYPVLMIGHRKRGEPAAATRRRIGRAFVLAVITATLGLGAMIFSGFPGLAQLGTFSAAGLLACAALTWTGLPRLIVTANLAPVAAGDPAWLGRVESWRRWRLAALLPVAAAASYLALLGGPHWEGDLANLSPVPAAARALDQTLRTEIGAPDAGQLLLIRGPDVQSVLERQEALAPILARLQASGAIAGAQDAATLLPSAARQAARTAALPPPDLLAQRIAEAQAGLPFKPGAFQPFLDGVAATRALPPLRRADLAGTPLGLRLDPLLLHRGDIWIGPIVLQGVADKPAVAAAVAGSPALYLDMRAELGSILSGYTARAWRWLAITFGLVVLVLAAGLPRPGLAARVLAAVLAAALLTVALLTAAGVELSLIHLVALQLVAGVGLDYALFFARRQLDEEERARTLRTLVTCNAMTLLTFGLLAFCETPILRDIGITVACGAFAALGFAFMLAGEAPRPA